MKARETLDDLSSRMSTFDKNKAGQVGHDIIDNGGWRTVWKLKDPVTHRSQKVIAISPRENQIAIKAKGYGRRGTKNSYGNSIIIEWCDGKLFVSVWDDINQIEPNHRIDLSNAKENLRGKRTPAMDQIGSKKLEADRLHAANLAYEGAELDVSVVDSDGWQTDGPDRLIRKFYYENPNDPKGDSLSGLYIVDFVRGTAKIEDVHSNL